MIKHMFNKMKSVHPVALAIIGWLAFGLGQIVDSIALKLVLLSTARGPARRPFCMKAREQCEEPDGGG